jgi:hypothetical protein
VTGEAADRLALRELFDAYAHCADRRDAEGHKALFTQDTRFAVYMDGEGTEPTDVLDGREALTPVFEDLNRYEVTPERSWSRIFATSTPSPRSAGAGTSPSESSSSTGARREPSGLDDRLSCVSLRSGR